HPFVLALIGGGLVGLAAVMMMGLKGRVAGVSGIFSSAFTDNSGDRLWRILFVLGIAIGGAIPALLSDNFMPPVPETSTLLLIIGGLGVGIGTGLSSGCTSGHGICGISHLSPRSMVATGTFMAAGFISVYLLKHVFGG
ncbi:MAG: YeeE/YedE family protein, partial [Gammaproteobacteria bacterium]